MGERTAYEPGTPSWVDLGTTDVPAAAAFYQSLFGWDAEEQGPEAGGYRMFTLGGKYVAGLGPAMNPGPPYWSTYITVADADETAALIEKEGGTILMPPMDVLDVGRMAIAMDPTGAAFALWQAKSHIGAQVVNDPNTLVWNELSTRDTARAQAFYAAVFGWTAETTFEDAAESGGESGEEGLAYTEFRLNGRGVAGMMGMMPGTPDEVPAHWLTYFAVDDCDAALERVQAGGGSVITPPMDISVGRFAVVSDPQGAVFSVIAMNETGD